MFASTVRRAAIVMTTLFAAMWMTASGAHADVPKGWAEDTHVPFIDFVWVLLVIPTGLALLTVAICMAFIRKGSADKPQD